MKRVKRMLEVSTRAYAICLPIVIGAIHGINYWSHLNPILSILSVVLGLAAAFAVRRLWGVVFPVAPTDGAY